jgi:hypothetical protein
MGVAASRARVLHGLGTSTSTAVDAPMHGLGQAVWDLCSPRKKLV